MPATEPTPGWPVPSTITTFCDRATIVIRLANALHKGLAPFQRVAIEAVRDEVGCQATLPDHRAQVP